MFNHISFNRSPFNHILAFETFLSVIFDSATDASAKLNVEIPVTIVIDTETDASTTLTNEIALVTGAIGTATELLTSIIRERMMRATIDTSTEFNVIITYTHVDKISFTGDLKPGDRLVIDTRNMTVTLNGQNAMHLVDGDFFSLVLGQNVVTYSDNETLRDILTRITHRDKYLY
ncbi:phage distal tail protein [Paenibacillus terrigena]|uniref:phage distal tail protein n=1 Tax=Paenibacillus terrigena TaxID=369333 RepID=UPI0028D5721C|nr:phage tail domain-containing protein [Paenibacillus terrigena]